MLTQTFRSSQVDSVDDTAALAIEEMLEKSVSLGRRFFVCGASGNVMAMFTRLQMVGQMLAAPDITRLAALQAATS